MLSSKGGGGAPIDPARIRHCVYACMCKCIDVDEATRQLSGDTIVVASCDVRVGLLEGCCMPVCVFPVVLCWDGLM